MAVEFALSEAQEQLRQTVQTLCDDVISRRADQVDHQGLFPTENHALLARAGVVGLGLPVEHGGANADALGRVVAMGTLARACGSTAIAVHVCRDLFGSSLAALGSAQQQRNWLPRLCTGELVGTVALTEPHGSELDRLTSRASRTASGWLLNGEKALILHAPVAQAAVVFAATDASRGDDGISCFVVDLDQQGVTRSEAYRKTGLRGVPVGGLSFNDVELPADALLGPEGAGGREAQRLMDVGGLGLAAFSVGISRAAMAAAVQYAGTREGPGGKKIQQHQAVHFKIADMHVGIECAELMTWRAALMWDRGQPGALVNIAKLFATETAIKVTESALQLHGGWGTTQEHPVDRFWRDARLGTVAAGNSELQREILAHRLLGF